MKAVREVQVGVTTPNRVVAFNNHLRRYTPEAARDVGGMPAPVVGAGFGKLRAAFPPMALLPSLHAEGEIRLDLLPGDRATSRHRVPFGVDEVS